MEIAGYLRNLQCCIAFFCVRNGEGPTQAPHCMQPTCPTTGSSSNLAEDVQFAQFLDAANLLGENLGVIFNASFEKLVSPSPAQPKILQEDNAHLSSISVDPMPLPSEQEVLCASLERGESCPGAAKVIRRQAHEIADLLARLELCCARDPDESLEEIHEVIAT